MISAFRSERRKLTAQLGTRLLILICAAGPCAFAVILKVQSGTPSDALFGVWVHSSGIAISLVVLGFAGSWGFPLLAGGIAGDLFAAEDRHGTWKTILTRSLTRRELFAGKLLAAGAFTAGLAALLAISSIAAGLVLVGGHHLINLSGDEISATHALGLTLAAWTICLLPALAYASVAVLFSVATRNGIVGVLGPLLVALATQLLDLIGKGVIVHLLLIGSAFDAWHGIFTTHPFFWPLIVSSAVSLVWIAASLAAAWSIVRRRDFLGASATRRPSWQTPLRTVALAVAGIAVLAVAANLGPTGVTAARLRDSLAPQFRRLTLLQQHTLGHSIPATARLDILPKCNRHAARAVGPGDWSCTLDIFILDPGHLPLTQTPVEYDVSVQYNGCYKAQSPPAFVGGQTIRSSNGRQVTNPLFIIYGCFDVL